MYLIHARLGPASVKLPESTVRLINENTDPADGLEHVSINLETMTIGLFIAAPTVLEAERVGETICRRVLDRSPEFTGLVLVSCQATLVPDYFNRNFWFEP
ncbi:hypothetical protein ACWD5Q_32835 [Streptomyces sp. NPDC002513]